MLEMVLVSLLWGFSFGLIKNTGIDPNILAVGRLLIAALVFLPFVRIRRLPARAIVRLLVTGAVQFGLMYVAYNFAFRYLKSYEVAVFTILTPIYIILLDFLLERHMIGLNALAGGLAILGAAIIQAVGALQDEVLAGFLIVQLSNLCFAFGQIYYKRLMNSLPGVQNLPVFALLYLGGALIAAISATLFGSWSALQLNGNQILSMLYLGAIASGAGFFLWNSGARKVNNGTLAVFNNLKIPVAVTISFLIFGERPDLTRLLLGSLFLITSLLITERKRFRLPIRRRNPAN